MKEIIIKTQNEIDALPSSFSDYTVIIIVASEKVIVSKARG